MKIKEQVGPGICEVITTLAAMVLEDCVILEGFLAGKEKGTGIKRMVGLRYVVAVSIFPNEEEYEAAKKRIIKPKMTIPGEQN